ncbi:hypothetical protein ABK905_02695 [Acerihabitans sp. KWT182]|uniref:Uncharacterized protein n=1 Tax=Acerihabitans sp. KWT182 TaxID=3157919 RepID=A0AAU7QAM8_9GAMM
MTIKKLTRAAVLLAAVALAPDADTATVSLVNTQAPGYYKIMVGGAQGYRVV